MTKNNIYTSIFRKKVELINKIGSVCIILVLFLVACSDKGDSLPQATAENALVNTAETISANDDQTVTIQLAVDAFEMAAYEPLAQAFEAENSGVEIQLVDSSDFIDLDASRMENALQLAQAVDIFPARYGAGVVPDNIIRDLKPFMQADATFDTADFYPNALHEINGRIYTLPTSLNYLLISYNKAAFDTANLAYPQPDWTWADFRATASTLTLRDGDEVSQWGFAQPFSTHLPFIEGQLQTPLADNSSTPTTFRFDDADVATAVSHYTSLFLVDETTPALPAADAYALIQANKVSMWPDTTQALDLSAEHGIVPLPANLETTNTSPLFINGWMMSAGTVNTEAAWKWMTFLSRQQPPATVANGAQLPARISVAEATGFWDSLTPEQSTTIRHAVEHSYLAEFSNRDDYRLLNDAINTIINNGEPVETALATAQTAVSNLATNSGTVDAFTVVADEETEADTSALTFILMTANGNEDVEAVRDLAKQFEAEHPDIRLDIRAGSMRNINLKTTASNADCFQWFAPVFKPEEQAAILSLDPLIEADPTFSLNDFYPGLVEQFTDAGQLWGIPSEAHFNIIEYNQDLFDAADVPYPQSGWTMDDFFETAVSLTTNSDDNKQYGFAASAIELYDLIYILNSLGAPIIDDSLTPPTILFNNPETIAAMRRYSSLTTDFEAKPIFISSPAELAGNNPDKFFLRPQLMNQQQIAMWTMPTLGDGVAMEPEIRETMSIGTVALPIGSGSSLSSMSGYFISATTDHRGTCWQWIKFLSTSPTIGQGLPANRIVAESDAYRQRIGNQLTEVYLDTLNNSSGSSVSFRLSVGDQSWMYESTFWFGRAYAQITNGDATVEEALNEAQATFDAYRTCMITNDGFANVEVRNNCVQQADPLLPTSLLRNS